MTRQRLLAIPVSLATLVALAAPIGACWFTGHGPGPGEWPPEDGSGDTNTVRDAYVDPGSHSTWTSSRSAPPPDDAAAALAELASTICDLRTSCHCSRATGPEPCEGDIDQEVISDVDTVKDLLQFDVACLEDLMALAENANCADAGAVPQAVTCAVLACGALHGTKLGGENCTHYRVRPLGIYSDCAQGLLCSAPTLAETGICQAPCGSDPGQQTCESQCGPSPEIPFVCGLR